MEDDHIEVDYLSGNRLYKTNLCQLFKRWHCYINMGKDIKVESSKVETVPPAGLGKVMVHWSG